MILNHFRAWAHTAPPASRAEGVRALVRAYLFSNLDEDKRRDALRVLTSFLDDPSALVRRTMAEALADEARAPHHIILGLADDQSSIAAIVLHRSPLLSDAELIDYAATTDGPAQMAIASRPSLSAPVSAALAEVGCAEALVALARNLGATLAASTISRMLARHSATAELREALLSRPDLTVGAHLELVGATTAALANLVGERNWMSSERMKRVSVETRDKASIIIADGSRGPARDIVAHLRQSGQLTVGFAFRAVLTGRIDLFEATLAELAGTTPNRAADIVARCGSTGFASLYRKAGLPMELLPAFRIALRILVDGETKPAAGGALSSVVVERVLSACAAINTGDLDQLLVLLRRFEGEAAREEARAAPSKPLILADEAPLVLDPAATAPTEVVQPSPARMPIFVPRTILPKAANLPEPTDQPVAPRERRQFVVDMAAIERELCAA